jgi:hypothetical protein
MSSSTHSIELSFRQSVSKIPSERTAQVWFLIIYSMRNTNKFLSAMFRYIVILSWKHFERCVYRYLYISDVIVWLIMILNIIVIMLIEYSKKIRWKEISNCSFRNGRLLASSYSFFLRWLTPPPSEMITNFHRVQGIVRLVIEVRIYMCIYIEKRERKGRKEK